MTSSEPPVNSRTGPPEGGSHVTWIAHAGLDEMYMAAQQEAAVLDFFKFPVSIIREGGRQMLNASIPLRELLAFTRSDSAPSRDATLEDVKNAYNRPLDEDHAKEFTNYMVENIEDPFIPSFSLNSNEPITVHFVPRYAEHEVNIPFGVVVLPRTTRLSIVDGQHRIFGLKKAYERLQTEKTRDAEHQRRNRDIESILDKSSVPVLITLEPDIRKSHLDFFDASRTKALPASQLAVYDVRNVARALLMDLVEGCALFNGRRIDYTNSKMSKKTPALYLFNQVYMAEKTFLSGGYGLAEEDFHSKARRMLKSIDDPKYLEMRDKIIDYFNAVTDAIPLLREASRLSDDRFASRILEYRDAGIILFTATGLAILARIGFNLVTSEEPNWRDVVQQLGEVNWKRSDPMWAAAGVVNGERVSTAHKSVIEGANAVEDLIGWTNPRRDRKGPEEPEIDLDEAVAAVTPASPATPEDDLIPL
jgi:DNA sulfur modification protein DndB